MRLIYLAGPYSHEDKLVRQRRVQSHAAALAFFANRTEQLCLYSPIVHWHGVAHDHELPHDFSFWMQQDFHMIKQATAMWVLLLDGWRDSYGLSQELEFAKSINRDILAVNVRGDEFILADAMPHHE